MATNASQLWTRLTGNASNTDATSYATASVSPTNGQVVLLITASLKATTPDTPTASGTNGFNGTWTQVGSTVTVQTPAGNFIGLSVLRSVATSGTAGIVTANYTNTQLASAWDLIISPYINTTTPIVQSKTTTSTDATTTLSLALDAALAAAANWVIGAFAHNAAAGPIINNLTSVEYSPSPAASATNVSDGIGLQVVVGPGTTSAIQGLTGSVAKAAFVMELAQDGTGVDPAASAGLRLYVTGT